MRALAVMAAAILLAGGGAHAAPPGKPSIKRTDVLRQDLGNVVGEAVQVRVDFAPGAALGMHIHPGEETAYVLQGSLAYHIPWPAAHRAPGWRSVVHSGGHEARCQKRWCRSKCGAGNLPGREGEAACGAYPEQG